jgi:hypothetical protein
MNFCRGRVDALKDMSALQNCSRFAEEHFEPFHAPLKQHGAPDVVV